MNRKLLVGMAVFALAGCNRAKEDDTKNLVGRALTEEQRAVFDADGLRPRMKLAQAITEIRKRHPEVMFDSRPSWRNVFDIGKMDGNGHQDKITVDTEEQLQGYPVHSITVDRYYGNGVKLESVMKTLTQKYGPLVQPEPIKVSGQGGERVDKPHGVYFAGELITQDGKILKRCLSGFDIVRVPPADCGLIAKILISESNGVVSSASVQIVDSRYMHALENRVVELKERGKQQDRDTQLNEAGEINSF